MGAHSCAGETAGGTAVRLQHADCLICLNVCLIAYGMSGAQRTTLEKGLVCK